MVERMQCDLDLDVVEKWKNEHDYRAVNLHQQNAMVSGL